MENFICNQYGEQLAILNTENLKFVVEWQSYRQQIRNMFAFCYTPAENLNF